MEERKFIKTMEYIVAALKERGYDPHAQLTGYVLHNDPTYITSHKDARKLIQTLDFERVRQYVENSLTMKKEKIKSVLVTIAKFLFNPRFLLCFGIAWLITNGWSYILLGIGTYFQIGWMMAVASAWLAFLWLPISPEKIVTVAIAMVLLRWLFPKDEKTLGILKELYAKAKIKKNQRKEKRDNEKKNSN